ncbi:MAG: transglycosylase SLT domain-containing protein [Deltaproteobacteria bacterium]|nr:transglycosylase SLT domain-containing protein [Deltaproteobacteria bacterium]
MFRFSTRYYFMMAFLSALFIFAGTDASAEMNQQTQAQIMEEMPVPDSVSLCGERMPLENREVWEMLDREITIAGWDRAQVYMWLKRAGRYFPHIEKSLAEENLPDDLKYLAVAESALITDIRSKRSALGIWQFMVSAARQNGMKKNRSVDERLSFERSTRAALKYLKNLKSVFGSWSLALAAYNCGSARLKDAIKEQEKHDYYRLRLPNETARFIFRIAAIKIIMENPELYGYRLSPERVYRPIEVDNLQINLRAPLHITTAAKALNTDYKTLKELNPHILGRYLPAGKYEICVPYGQSAKLTDYIKNMPRTSTGSKTGQGKSDFYVVKRGDTLSQIAQRTGVSMTTIKRLNRLKDTRIMIGQKLRLTP